MKLALPIFFLFSVYGVINNYLSLILRSMGYSATITGTLLSIFEIGGIIFPLLLSSLIEKKGTYGLFLLLCGIIMIIVPIPFLSYQYFTITAFCLLVFALGFKGAVPVSDTVVTMYLGADRAKYGMVRSMGSIGFVIMNLIMQGFFRIETSSKSTILLWIIIPAILFTLSLFLVPGIMKVNLGFERIFDNSSSNNKVKNKKLSIKGLFSLVQQSLSGFSTYFWIGISLLFVGFLGMTPYMKFISMYVTEELHSNTSSLLWAISAASEVPFMFFSYRFLRKYGSEKLLVFCTLVVGIRGLIYMLVPNLGGAIVAQLLNSITYGLYHPAAVLFVSNVVPENKRVLGMSFYSVGAVGISAMIGNVIGGIVIDNLGYKALFTFFSVIPIIAVCIVFLFRKKIELLKPVNNS